jgi:hypothetical protein
MFSKERNAQEIVRANHSTRGTMKNDLALAGLLGYEQLLKEGKLARTNIEDWKVRLEKRLHQSIHQGGPNGGNWNEEWRKFLRGGKRTSKEIFDFATELMQKYGVNASQIP